MKRTKEKNIRQIRRRRRVRARVRGTAQRPRMTVFRSNRYLWVQLIDDTAGRTIAAANEREVAASKKEGRIVGAEKLGALLARRATEQAIAAAVFDRGSYRYHGLVRAAAEGARKAGLKM